MFKILLPILLIFLTACNNSTSKQKVNLNAKELLIQKCGKCHNLDLPPKTSEDELAPPMMAVAFHVRDFVKVSNESERDIKAKEFVRDYVINPSEDKSFCDKESLKRYGVMPSLKGKVSEDELIAISNYIFKQFTPQNLAQEQAIIRKLQKMPKGKRLALKYNCLSCHNETKKIVGPSFHNIALKYSVIDIENGIKNGSSKKWPDSHGAIMPKFKNKIDQKDMKILAKWIKSI